MVRHLPDSQDPSLGGQRIRLQVWIKVGSFAHTVATCQFKNVTKYNIKGVSFEQMSAYLNAKASTGSFWRKLFVGLQRWVGIFFVDTIIPVLAIVTSIKQTQILHDYACRKEKNNNSREVFRGRKGEEERVHGYRVV